MVGGCARSSQPPPAHTTHTLASALTSVRASRTSNPVPRPPQTHNADGRGLAVRESLLPGAGSGLFATGAWAGGAIICEYRGKVRRLMKVDFFYFAKKKGDNHGDQRGATEPEGFAAAALRGRGSDAPCMPPLAFSSSLERCRCTRCVRCFTSRTARISWRASTVSSQATLSCAHSRRVPDRRSLPPAQALSLNLYIDSGPADGVAGPLSLGRFLNDHPDPSRINVRFEKARGAPTRLCCVGVGSRSTTTHGPLPAADAVSVQGAVCCHEGRRSGGGAVRQLRRGAPAFSTVPTHSPERLVQQRRLATSLRPPCVLQKYWARLGGIPGGGGGEEEYRQMAARMQRQDAAE